MGYNPYNSPSPTPQQNLYPNLGVLNTDVPNIGDGFQQGKIWNSIIIATVVTHNLNLLNMIFSNIFFLCLSRLWTTAAI